MCATARSVYTVGVEVGAAVGAEVGEVGAVAGEVGAALGALVGALVCWKSIGNSFWIDSEGWIFMETFILVHSRQLCFSFGKTGFEETNC